jgi:hypothetical protein
MELLFPEPKKQKGGGEQAEQLIVAPGEPGWFGVHAHLSLLRLLLLLQQFSLSLFFFLGGWRSVTPI